VVALAGERPDRRLQDLSPPLLLDLRARRHRR
jgi:hypothetical protein